MSSLLFELHAFQIYVLRTTILDFVHIFILPNAITIEVPGIAGLSITCVIKLTKGIGAVTNLYN